MAGMPLGKHATDQGPDGSRHRRRRIPTKTRIPTASHDIHHLLLITCPVVVMVVSITRRHRLRRCLSSSSSSSSDPPPLTIRRVVAPTFCRHKKKGTSSRTSMVMVMGGTASTRVVAVVTDVVLLGNISTTNPFHHIVDNSTACLRCRRRRRRRLPRKKPGTGRRFEGQGQVHGRRTSTSISTKGRRREMGKCSSSNGSSNWPHRQRRSSSSRVSQLLRRRQRLQTPLFPARLAPRGKQRSHRRQHHPRTSNISRQAAEARRHKRPLVKMATRSAHHSQHR